LYYLSRATEKVKREDLQQVLLRQGAQREQTMTTIAQEYIQEGIKLGIEQGIEQGRLEEKRHIARQLLKLLDVAKVSEITGLTIAEVKTLQKAKNGKTGHGR
jgi:predicted transposase/invertase (TIGR01784 family)